MSNVINIEFGDRTLCCTEPYYKYDSGMYLLFSDLELPESYQVHFSNKRNGSSYESIGDSDGVLIPDDVWRTGKTIYAWLYLHPTEDSAVTAYEVQIPVSGRANLPDGTEPTPSEQSAIDQAITALNNAVEQTAEDVETTAQNAATATTAAETATTAATQATNSAESAANAAETASTAANTATEASTAAVGANTQAQAAATNAEQSANRAEQAAADAGYMFFDIDENGDLIYQRTSNVDIDFYLDDGDLYVEAIA